MFFMTTISQALRYITHWFMKHQNLCQETYDVILILFMPRFDTKLQILFFITMIHEKHNKSLPGKKCRYLWLHLAHLLWRYYIDWFKPRLDIKHKHRKKIFWNLRNYPQKISIHWLKSCMPFWQWDGLQLHGAHAHICISITFSTLAMEYGF